MVYNLSYPFTVCAKNILSTLCRGATTAGRNGIPMSKTVEYGTHTHSCDECGNQMSNNQLGVCDDCQSRNGDKDGYSCQ